MRLLIHHPKFQYGVLSLLVCLWLMMYWKFYQGASDILHYYHFEFFRLLWLLFLVQVVYNSWVINRLLIFLYVFAAFYMIYYELKLGWELAEFYEEYPNYYFSATRRVLMRILLLFVLFVITRRINRNTPK